MVLIQLIANGVVTGCMYALVALGFGLIYNTTKTFHIAHGAVYTVAAYMAFTFHRILGFDPVLSSVLALIAAGILGVLMEVSVYYPLYKKRASLGVSFISSLGVYILLVNFIALLYGSQNKLLSHGVEKTFGLGVVMLTRVQILQIVCALLSFILLLIFLKTTKMGKTIRALSDNPELLCILGRDVRTVRICIFAMGSFLAAMASVLVAFDVGVDPHVGINAVLVAAVVVIISGVGVFGGPLLGAFLLGILQNLVVWKTSARWEEAVTFLILILFLLFRPHGILGERKRLEET